MPALLVVLSVLHWRATELESNRLGSHRMNQALVQLQGVNPK